jgi:hypothetical protein
VGIKDSVWFVCFEASELLTWRLRGCRKELEQDVAGYAAGARPISSGNIDLFLELQPPARVPADVLDHAMGRGIRLVAEIVRDGAYFLRVQTTVMCPSIVE